MIFSILTPAYNAEKFIERCITSVLEQNFKDFEFIIVDDGSVDDTYQVCLQYAKKDKRIKLIRQENQGVAATRNILLENAQGEWITFVDADDYIHNHYLCTFLKCLQASPEVDVFISDYFSVVNETLVSGKSNSFKTKTEFIIRLLDFRKVNTALWGKIIRRDFITANGISFKPGIDMGEDLLFMTRLFPSASDIHYISEKLYYWVRNTNSMTSNQRSKYYTDIVKVYDIIDEYYKSKTDYLLYKALIQKSKLYLKSQFRLSRNDEVRTLSKEIYIDLSFRDFSIPGKVLLLFLKIDFVFGIRILRKLFVGF